MNGVVDNKDSRVMGSNPCAEITLENKELCNIVETYPARHDSYQDYLRTVKIAYLYNKTITLTNTHWPETNQVMLKNRRLGISQSGIVQAINRFGLSTMMKWNNDSYGYLEALDAKYSDWLCIPRSKKLTTVKPSGSVSLLNGSTPGIHFPESEYYVRRIRFSHTSDMLPTLIAAGHHVEPCVYSPNTMVVSFPVHEEYFQRGKQEVTLWEQMELAAKYQETWADNSVSITVTFKNHEAPDIERVLEHYENRLKCVSFLRYIDTGYQQAPYEPISVEQYNILSAGVVPVQRFGDLSQGGVGEKYCDGDKCEISFS
jgi:ribonucleotide reductase alpha subunit